jgi:hypothetical protein
MCLPALLVGEGVDDRERRRSGLDPEPHHGLRLALDERQGPSQEGGELVLFPGLCLEPDDQSYVTISSTPLSGVSITADRLPGWRLPAVPRLAWLAAAAELDLLARWRDHEPAGAEVL